MNTYEEYVQMLTVALEEQSSSRGLCFRKSFANNQISLDAVCLKGEKISPVLYMQSYYKLNEDEYEYENLLCTCLSQEHIKVTWMERLYILSDFQIVLIYPVEEGGK